MILQASVILCTGGGVCLRADTPWSRPPMSRHPPEQTPPGSRHPPRADTPPGADPPGADTPLEQTPPPEQTPPLEQTPPKQTPPRPDTPPGSRLQHTVNERPVRILLECILVNYLKICSTFYKNEINRRLYSALLKNLS